MHNKKRLSTIISVVLLGIIAVGFLFPFVWMVATSLKPTTEVFSLSPTGSRIAWDNYPSALNSIPFGRVVLNSFIVSLAGAALVVVVSVLSGADLGAGFAAVKAAAVAVADALDQAPLALSRGRLTGLWFQRARARRVENGAARRVDLTFRARIDLG